jgi:DNA-binding protein
MKQFNSGNTNYGQQQRWQEGSGRHSDSQGSTYTHYPKQFETQLLPNEIRISTKGSFSGYVRSILSIMDQGYKNCKIVARGMAVEYAHEVFEEVKSKLSPHQFTFNTYDAQSLNMKGTVCDEFHIMISVKDSNRGGDGDWHGGSYYNQTASRSNGAHSQY